MGFQLPTSTGDFRISKPSTVQPQPPTDMSWISWSSTTGGTQGEPLRLGDSVLLCLGSCNVKNSRYGNFRRIFEQCYLKLFFEKHHTQIIRNPKN